MIARTWRGSTRAADADRYTAYILETGIAAYRATPGNAGAWILRRVAAARADFTVISFWEDEAAIRRFAGDDPERAVFFPEDDAFLVGRDLRVAHWEVAATRSAPDASTSARAQGPVSGLVGGVEGCRA